MTAACPRTPSRASSTSGAGGTRLKLSPTASSAPQRSWAPWWCARRRRRHRPWTCSGGARGTPSTTRRAISSFDVAFDIFPPTPAPARPYLRLKHPLSRLSVLPGRPVSAQVSASGIEDGLQSLASCGTPARTLIIDDGWQTVRGCLCEALRLLLRPRPREALLSCAPAPLRHTQVARGSHLQLPFPSAQSHFADCARRPLLWRLGHGRPLALHCHDGVHQHQRGARAASQQ